MHAASALPGAVEPVLASAPLAAGAPASDWLMLSRPKALVPAHPEVWVQHIGLQQLADDWIYRETVDCLPVYQKHRAPWHLSAWRAPSAVIEDVESTGLDRCSCCHRYDATRKAWFAAVEALAVYCHCDEVQKVHQARNPI